MVSLDVETVRERAAKALADNKNNPEGNYDDNYNFCCDYCYDFGTVCSFFP